MLEQRRNLIQDRRRAAAETKRQKESIAKVMEEVRSNATKAQQLISNALAGKLSLAEIAKGTASPLGRSKSTNKLQSLSGKKQTTMELLGLDRSTQSAGFSMDSREYDPTKKSSFLTSAGANDDIVPLPYVSPYDPNGMLTVTR